MLHGLIEIPAWMLVLITFALTHITIITVTVFLHRHQAHRALAIHPAVSHFFRFWLWLTTGMVTKEWVAVHRKHHAKVETKDDPHSPKILGINKVLWRGAMLYRVEAAKQATLDEYGHGTPDDWIEKVLYTPHSTTGILVMLVIDLLLFGLIAGPIMWGVQMIWIPFFAAGVINGVGHWGGYRNFNTPDTSTNIVPWGILIGGEELHNNHHAHASSAKFSMRKWEFDVSWYYILLLEKLGLAKVKKVAPKPQTDPGKLSVDLDTLRAIFTHRFQILTNYGKNVVQPILKRKFSARKNKL